MALDFEGDRSFSLNVSNAAYTRFVDPTDRSYPQSAARLMTLFNAGTNTIFVVKGTPAQIAALAVSEAAARAFAGFVKAIEPGAEFSIPAAVGSFPDCLRLANYYALALTNNDDLIINPVN
jgi:hypothetical protein